MNYYSFHIGDYKSHTNHLSLLEDLAYRRMLDMYYLTESPLPDTKQIARHICMRDNIEDIQVVLDEFFKLTPDGYIHARCEREIQAMNNKSGKAKASAQARWERQRNANAQESQCERNANASKNHANASNLDANAMRNGCEGNAPNPNTHNPTPIPEKKEKSAYEESENPVPPTEPEPAYAKTDTQQPYTDSRAMFEMTSDWQPTDSIKPLLGRAGLPTDVSKLDQSRIGDFVNHWFGNPERRTADGWNGLLVGFLKRRQHDKPSQPENTRKNQAPIDSRQVDGPIYPIFKDEPEPPRLTGIELEAMKITGQRIMAGEKNVEYADVLAELQARRNAS